MKNSSLSVVLASVALSAACGNQPSQAPSPRPSPVAGPVAAVAPVAAAADPAATTVPTPAAATTAPHGPGVDALFANDGQTLTVGTAADGQALILMRREHIGHVGGVGAVFAFHSVELPWRGGRLELGRQWRCDEGKTPDCHPPTWAKTRDDDVEVQARTIYAALFERGRAWTLPIAIEAEADDGQVHKTRGQVACEVAAVRELGTVKLAKVSCRSGGDDLSAEVGGAWAATEAGLVRLDGPELVDGIGGLADLPASPALFAPAPFDDCTTLELDGDPVATCVSQPSPGLWCANQVGGEDDFTLCLGADGTPSYVDVTVGSSPAWRARVGARPAKGWRKVDPRALVAR